MTRLPPTPSTEDFSTGLERLFGNKVSPENGDLCQVGQPLLEWLPLDCRQGLEGPSLIPVCLSQGLKGTYQGLTATVLKQGSNQAIRFFVMTSLRNWYQGTPVAQRRIPNPEGILFLEGEAHPTLGSS